MQAVYLNHYLTDKDVANFARQSFSASADNFTYEQNNRLVRFLARGMEAKDYDKLVEDVQKGGMSREEAKALLTTWRSTPEHWAPFGHPSISLRMKAPVPIRTQCFKHKQGLVESEESRRYIKSIPEFYVPEYFRVAADNVKQGSGDAPHPDSDSWIEAYSSHCKQGILLYLDMLDAGICPEQARFVLPQGVEVNWVWTGSLYAFARFYVQRAERHSQKEIQHLAEQVGEIIEPLFPISWAALTRAEY